jgi:putative ABC transport system permease protein
MGDNKRPEPTIINIGGLALSLASFLFIFYYVYDELTYDQFHQNIGRRQRLPKPL